MTWKREDVRAAFVRQLERRQRDLSAGRGLLGWKLGFGTPAAMTKLGLDAPLIGYLLRDSLVESGGTLAVGSWTQPKIETEIALRVDRDLPAEATREQCEQAIGGTALAFELIDLTLREPTAVQLLDANVLQRAVVLGEWAGPCAKLPPVTIEVDGRALTVDADPVAAIGDPVDVVGHVCRVLGELGPGLRAGDVLITGALSAPDFAPGQRHAATAAGLGEIAIEAVP